MTSGLNRILVVGGGAGGLELVTTLGRRLGLKRLARPILLEGSPTHIWKPLLHEVATGALNTGEDEVNYFAHAHTNGYQFEFGWMRGLDPIKRQVHIAPILDEDGRVLVRERSQSYDTLVLAVGGETNTFGTPGVQENCLFLNTPAQAEYLRRRILCESLSVAMGTSAVPKLRIGIVGGGATGVELAAEIHHTICELRQLGANFFQEQLEMTIMDGADRILGAAPAALSKYATEELEKRNIVIRTNTAIKGVSKEGFLFTDGTLLPADIKIWAAGIKAPDWLSTLGLSVSRTNQVKVNEGLQSVDDPNVYGIGDCAWCPDSTAPADLVRALPATAQVAHQEAEWLAAKLEARLTGRTVKPFKYKPQGMLVSLGEGTAVGSLLALLGPNRSVHVQGRGAKVLYSSLYRMHQAAIYGWYRATLLWIGDKLRKVAMPQIKLH